MKESYMGLAHGDEGREWPMGAESRADDQKREDEIIDYIERQKHGPALILLQDLHRLFNLSHEEVGQYLAQWMDQA